MKFKVNKNQSFELTYNDFMNSYNRIVSLHFGITDIFILLICSYLIKANNEIEGMYKKYFIEFSIKLFFIIASFISFFGTALLSQFDLKIMLYAFITSILLIFIPQLYFYSVVNVFNRNVMFEKWELIRSNIAITL